MPKQDTGQGKGTDRGDSRAEEYNKFHKASSAPQSPNWEQQRDHVAHSATVEIRPLMPSLWVLFYDQLSRFTTSLALSKVEVSKASSTASSPSSSSYLEGDREERRAEKGQQGGGSLRQIKSCGWWSPRVRMERVHPGRATTSLLGRQPPDLAPRVDCHGRGQGTATKEPEAGSHDAHPDIFIVFPVLLMYIFFRSSAFAIDSVSTVNSRLDRYFFNSNWLPRGVA